MSNMLFCCSILYKTKLPIVVVFNKNDIADASVPIGWMKNFDLFMVLLTYSRIRCARAATTSAVSPARWLLLSMSSIQT